MFDHPAYSFRFQVTCSCMEKMAYIADFYDDEKIARSNETVAGMKFNDT